MHAIVNAAMGAVAFCRFWISLWVLLRVVVLTLGLNAPPACRGILDFDWSPALVDMMGCSDETDTRPGVIQRVR